jgi:hypothetical protein
VYQLSPLYLIHKKSARTSQTTQSLHVTKSKWLMPFRDIIFIYCENHTKHTNMKDFSHLLGKYQGTTKTWHGPHSQSWRRSASPPVHVRTSQRLSGNAATLCSNLRHPQNQSSSSPPPQKQSVHPHCDHVTALSHDGPSVNVSTIPIIVV